MSIYRDEARPAAVNWRQRIALTVPEAAEALGISERQLHRLAERGIIRKSHELGRPLLAVAQLERILEHGLDAGATTDDGEG